jgi:hypothetical protein
VTRGETVILRNLINSISSIQSHLVKASLHRCVFWSREDQQVNGSLRMHHQYEVYSPPCGHFDPSIIRCAIPHAYPNKRCFQQSKALHPTSSLEVSLLTRQIPAVTRNVVTRATRPWACFETRNVACKSLIDGPLSLKHRISYLWITVESFQSGPRAANLICLTIHRRVFLIIRKVNVGKIGLIEPRPTQCYCLLLMVKCYFSGNTRIIVSRE